MALYIRRNLISLPRRIPNPWSSRLSFSSAAAAAEERRITIAEYLQQRHQFSPDALSKLVSSGKPLTNPDKCDSVLSFFKDAGFSTNQLEQMVKRLPKFLSASVDLTIKPKIKLLQDAGLSPAAIADIISTSPSILYRGTDKVGLAISQLKRLLGSSQGLFKVFKKCNSLWFITGDLNKTMIPNLELLLSCGICSSQISSFMHHSPTFMFHTHEHIKKCVDKVEEMGCLRSSKMFLHAIHTVASISVENWERKLLLFRSLGFSEDDIRSTFRRAPRVFTISERKLKESIQVLLDARNDDISLIVNHPGLLIFSVEKTLKPRLRVLEVLEGKNLIVKKKTSWVSHIYLSNEAFLKKFVTPYSAEVGAIYNPQKGCT